MKGLLRATMRSHNSDWLSCRPMDRAAFTGSPSYSRLRPCSYRAWPVSWMVAIRPSRMSASWYRDVMRTSVGWVPPVKGCTLTSIRPLAKSKPMSFAIFRLSSACFSTETFMPAMKEASGLEPLLSSSRSGTTPALSSANISSMRAEVMPGSNSSMSTSYGGREGSIMLAFVLEILTQRSRNGANLLKSEALRASTHACMALLSSSAISFARSLVIDDFLLKSRLASSMTAFS
mmetsp:Transcript_12953/g.36405  ORF Transcript_12953/g.36405 Transcript_12953/m.36405 type:complete len:233 (-) Transcript_12953:461-1159(-)